MVLGVVVCQCGVGSSCDGIRNGSGSELLLIPHVEHSCGDGGSRERVGGGGSVSDNGTRLAAVMAARVMASTVTVLLELSFVITIMVEVGSTAFSSGG